MSDQFHQITQNFHTKPKSDPRTVLLGLGTLLSGLAILSTIPWGFGADRFLWIAAASGGTGVALVTIGAIVGRTNKEKK